MRILVLGGYGLIGGEILRALEAAGFQTVGLGRDAGLGARLHPRSGWIAADLSTLGAPAAWGPHLAGVDAVVNAAGVLQESRRDRVVAVQDAAIRACVAACEAAHVSRFVQISAVGAAPGATTAFLRSKATADAALRASGLDWIIFKPGLVISRNAYGGTALVRMLAGFPFVTPLVDADARVQTVAAADVARAVVMTLAGRVPTKADYDLVETEAHSLRDIVGSFRAWLGFAPAAVIVLPRWIGSIAAAFADLAGSLGWRSPLRSTALKALAEGVLGDARPFEKATGVRLKDLKETLADNPSTLQERVFARAQLALPVALVVLSLFWIVSGMIGLLSRHEAAALIEPAVGAAPAMGLVIVGAGLHLVIGAGLLVQASARRFAALSIAVAAAYLVIGSFIAPSLWLDPLGPYVKVAPAMALGLVVALLLEKR